MELIYQYYDLAIVVACLCAIIGGALVLGAVLFVFRQGREEDTLEEVESE